ncbi:MAG TPA: hypothetical protein VEB22_07175 [Phycisphaerales bacterium]|nr:hypothetical protein [Phycisphaerales bacterium]
MQQIMERRIFPPRFPEMGFAMDVPSDFVSMPLPEEGVSFDSPETVAPLGLASSQVALAIVGVAARPAYTEGAVSQWLGYLAHQQGIDLSRARPGMVGPHPGVLADGRQIQDGTEVWMRVGAFEDGGRLVLVTGMTTAALVPSFGEALEAAVLSVALTDGKGPSANILPEGM